MYVYVCIYIYIYIYLCYSNTEYLQSAQLRERNILCLG